MELSERLLEQMEDRLNLLLTDETIAALRRAAADYVVSRLACEVEERCRRELALTEGEWQALLAGELPEGLTEKKLIEKLALSRERGQEFRFLRDLDSHLPPEERQAGRWLLDRLTEREMVAFRTRAKIPAATWKRFLDQSSYTGEQTVRRLAEGLALTPEEEGELRKRIIRREFEDDRPLRPPVREKLKAKGLSVTEFLTLALLSKDAWVHFQNSPEPAPIRQSTLLRLVVGLTMEEGEAAEFLALVGSRFVMRRDLVVLAAIQGGIYGVDVLYALLEQYSRSADDPVKPLYRNLYPPPKN